MTSTTTEENNMSTSKPGTLGQVRKGDRVTIEFVARCDATIDDDNEVAARTLFGASFTASYWPADTPVTITRPVEPPKVGDVYRYQGSDWRVYEVDEKVHLYRVGDPGATVALHARSPAHLFTKIEEGS
jgi:hypothetical protein